ncbi:hypothetical protein CFE70_010215 [Pyrenophora teres f. teres 0-1]
MRAIQSNSNPFEFYARIMKSQECSGEWPEGCAKFDTGSKDNWMSGSTVDRTRNSSKSWETRFLVSERASFDILLDRNFIINTGIFVFADPVLMTDMSRFVPVPKEKTHHMEQNMRKRGVENQELLKARETVGKFARERRGAEKAASRARLVTSHLILTTYVWLSDAHKLFLVPCNTFDAVPDV